MAVLRLEVRSLVPNKHFLKWCTQANNCSSIPLKKIEEIRFYKISSQDLPQHKLNDLITKYSDEIFFDPIIEELNSNNPQYIFDLPPAFAIEVSYKPGVTNNTANTAMEALKLLQIDAQVSSGSLYFLFGPISHIEALKISKEYLGNELIQAITVYSLNDKDLVNRFNNVSFPQINLDHNPQVKEISLDISDYDLMKISDERCLALSLEELVYIKDYFKSKTTQKNRTQKGLPLWPTDVELEILAQTWSEHCKHKIFNSEINFTFQNNIQKINSLYKTYIKGLTQKVKNERKLDWLMSVFSDNAGIVRFDSNIDLCIKVETHNSPSALDPYGGALTGILGVNRDILGCGMGARPIANTDVFCFAPPSWPPKGQERMLPDGPLHPRRIFDGVHKGIEDGGNKSGIPTVNGAIYFDPNYAGKPLVFCGTIGVMPHKISNNVPSATKSPHPNDHVVMVGGAIGADGIHGATFSSLELSESSPTSAVQIGDPITQKRMLDFLLEARDKGLYSCITDNGAGGLSSSVGEMALLTNGATVDLFLAPVKYPGLSPYELMISESQERMTLAIPPNKLKSFLELASRRGVNATSIGTFNNSGMLSIYFNQELVGELDLEFLHNSLPPMKLSAKWNGPRPYKPWLKTNDKDPINLDSSFYSNALLRLLSSSNICSKESWVRQYDHEVQAATHIKPFVGSTNKGPSDSAVIWTFPHGGEKENAISIGCGLNPRLSQYDPYLMAQYSVDEAIRNIVSSGGNPDVCCLLDNFCWPDPVKSSKNADGHYKLGQLVRSCQGLFDICSIYGTPLVSGKDSMKNDFRGKNKKGEHLTISILPTLLITAMSQTSILNTCTTSFKNEGDLIYLLGRTMPGLAGSEFAECYHHQHINFESVPSIDINSNIELYRLIYKAHQRNIMQSCHDVSDGGLLVTIVESMIGGNLGAKIYFESKIKGNFFDICELFFNESAGRFIVSVKPENQKTFEKHFSKNHSVLLGQVTKEKKLNLFSGYKQLIDLPISQLIAYWEQEL